MTEEIIKEIEDFISGLNIEIDIWQYIEIEEIDLEDPFNSIIDAINENYGFNDAGEVICYSNAMRYLSQNDASLQESLALADELGYTLKDLNSEILASLLKSQNIQNDFYELQDKIERFFEEIQIKIEALEEDKEE